MRTSFISLILLLLLGACSRPEVTERLAHINHIIGYAPDSAIQLLDTLDLDVAKMSESNLMYYHLLTIKANDKAYVTHQSDSLMLVVLSYYENSHDMKMLPEVYYYAGRVYRDLGDAPRALTYFQKASQNNNNNYLLSKIYSQKGMIYLLQGMSEKTMSSFQKAHEHATLLNDSITMVYTFRDMGRAYTVRSHIDSTFFYYNKALELSKALKDDKLIGIICREKANIHRQLGQYQEAISLLTNNPPLNKFNYPPYYANLADYYFDMSKIDSAQYYYWKLTTMGNHHHKKDAYKGLLDIARLKGNYREALVYMDKYWVYADSIRQEDNIDAIHKIDGLYNYKLHENEKIRIAQTAENRKIVIIMICVLLLMLLIIVTYYIKQRKMEILNVKKELERISENKYRQSEKYISENEKRIAELEEKLQNKQLYAFQLEDQYMHQEKIILEQENKLVRSRIKLQELSVYNLRNSQTYKDFCHVAGLSGFEELSTKEKITAEDWEDLKIILNETNNMFVDRLYELYPKMTSIELNVTMLLKIQISPTGISKITNKTAQAVGSIRQRLYEKVNKEKGSSKDWDEFIANF